MAPFEASFDGSANVIGNAAEDAGNIVDGGTQSANNLVGGVENGGAYGVTGGFTGWAKQQKWTQLDLWSFMQ